MSTLCILYFLSYTSSSLWGKFAQRDNMKQVLYTRDPAEFFDLMSNDGINPKRIDSIGDDMVRVEYDYESEFIDEQSNVNIAVAVMTTSYARLELYRYLDILGPRTLYFDTGECIVYHNKHNHCYHNCQSYQIIIIHNHTCNHNHS